MKSDNELKEIIRGLQGISALEWSFIRRAIDRVFDCKKSELEKNIQFKGEKDVDFAVCSLR